MTSQEAEQAMDQEQLPQQHAAALADVDHSNLPPGMFKASLSDHNQQDHADASQLTAAENSTKSTENMIEPQQHGSRQAMASASLQADQTHQQEQSQQQQQQQHDSNQVQDDEDLFGEKDSPVPGTNNSTDQVDTVNGTTNGYPSGRVDDSKDQPISVLEARSGSAYGDQPQCNNQEAMQVDQANDNNNDQSGDQGIPDQAQTEQADDAEAFIPLEETGPDQAPASTDQRHSDVPAEKHQATNNNSQQPDEYNASEPNVQHAPETEQPEKDMELQQQHRVRQQRDATDEHQHEGDYTDTVHDYHGEHEQNVDDEEPEHSEHVRDSDGDAYHTHKHRGGSPAGFEAEEPLIWEDATEDPDVDMHDASDRELHHHHDRHVGDQHDGNQHEQDEDIEQLGGQDGYAVNAELAEQGTRQLDSKAAVSEGLKLEKVEQDHTQPNSTSERATLGDVQPSGSLGSKQLTLAEAIAAGDAAIRSSSKTTVAKEGVDAQKRKRSPIRYELDKPAHPDSKDKDKGVVRSVDKDKDRQRASDDRAVDRRRGSDRVDRSSTDKAGDRSRSADKPTASDRSADRSKERPTSRYSDKQMDRPPEKQKDRSTDRPSRKASSPAAQPRDSRHTSRPAARSPARRRSRSRSPARQQPRSTATTTRPEHPPARRSRSPDRRASQAASRPAQPRDQPVSPGNRKRDPQRDSYDRNYDQSRGYDRDGGRQAVEPVRRPREQQPMREPPSPMARKPQQYREPMPMSRGMKNHRQEYDEVLRWHLIDERLADPVDYDPRMLSPEPMFRGRPDDRSSRPHSRPMQRALHPAALRVDYNEDYDDYPPARMRHDDPYDLPQRRPHPRMELEPPPSRRPPSPSYRAMPPYHADYGPPSPRGDYRLPPPPMRQLPAARHDPYEPQGGRYHDPGQPLYDLDERPMRRSPGRPRMPYGGDEYGYEAPMFDERSRDRGRDTGRPAAREPDARPPPVSRDVVPRSTHPSARADSGSRGRSPAARTAPRASSPPQRRLSRDRTDPRDRSDIPVSRSPRRVSEPHKQYSSGGDQGRNYPQQPSRGRASPPRSAAPSRPAENSRSRPEERPSSIDRGYRRDEPGRGVEDGRGVYKRGGDHDSRAAGRDVSMSDTVARRGRDARYPDSDLPPAKRMARDVPPDNVMLPAQSRNSNAPTDQGRSTGPQGKQGLATKAPLPPHPNARGSDGSMQRMPLASKTESRSANYGVVGGYQAGSANPPSSASDRQNWSLPNNAAASHTNVQQGQMQGATGVAASTYNGQGNASNVGGAGVPANVLAANAAALLGSLPASQAAALLQAAVESGNTMLLTGQGMAGGLVQNANALNVGSHQTGLGGGLAAGNASVYSTNSIQQQPGMLQQQQQRSLGGMAGQNMSLQNTAANNMHTLPGPPTSGFGYASNMTNSNNNVSIGNTPQLPHGFNAPAASTARAVDETSNIWYYLDPDSVQQGPCSIQQFKMWLGTMRSQPSLAQQLHQFEMALTWSTQDPRRRPLWQIVKEFS